MGGTARLSVHWMLYVFDSQKKTLIQILLCLLCRTPFYRWIQWKNLSKFPLSFFFLFVSLKDRFYASVVFSTIVVGFFVCFLVISSSVK